MKSAAVLVAALAGTAGVANAAGTANYKPDYKAVRALMTDTKFLTLTTPCVAPNSKRFISAEWIRTVFHDAATYDKNTGTGGIDGSIGLELQRPENAGDAIRDSLSQFRAFNQDGVSMADITVLGAIMATLSCGGPEIPFRYGRADTKIPNVDGLTPMPDQPVHVHAGQFKRMGFNATEMIQLVACGHTLGGVHAQFHPELTNQPMAAFDSTRTVFDNAVAVEWINGSSKNPLALPVGAGALGTSSDANIYNSDGNVTMSRLASSKKAFDDACSHVFSRMFNEAIPKETVLSDIVAPYPVTAGFDSKLINELFHLRIGTIRLWKMAGTYKNVTLDYYRRDGTLGDRADLNVKPSKTLMNGLLETWDFTTGNKPIDPVTGISGIKVTVIMNDGSVYADKEGGALIPIDDTVRVDGGAGFTCKIKNATPDTPGGLLITVAVLGGANENVFITYKRADGTLGPRIKAIYRRPRDGTPYSYYGLHIPNITTFDQGRGISAFGAVAVRPAGESIDINQGIWFKADFPIGCKANLTFPEDPFVFVMPPATTTVAPSSTTAVPSASTGSAVIGVATTIAGDKPAYPSNSPVTEPTTEEPGVYASSAVGLLSGVVGSVVSAALGWMALF